MRIDSHQHFWYYTPENYSWIDDSMKEIRRDFLPPEFAPLMLKNNIDASVVVQVQQTEAETKFLLELSEKYEFIKGVVGWVDLTAEDVEKRVAYFARNPVFKGVRHTVYDSEGEFLLHPSFLRGIEVLGKYGLSFDLLVYESQLKAAFELANSFPDQAFVLNHLGKPDLSNAPSKAWRQHMRKLSTCDNVYAKLSGMTSQPREFKGKYENLFPFLDVLFETFGSKRLMYGSDWPVANCSGTYEATLALLTEYLKAGEEGGKADIFGKTAQTFYRLNNK